jgi:hypothetical protein
MKAITERRRVAYWLRTDSQHWEHVRPLYENIGGFILTKNRDIYEYLRTKVPGPGDDLVFVKNSAEARRFLFRHRIKVVVYTGFQHIFWGFSVQVFHGASDKNYLLSKNRVLLYDLLLLPGMKHYNKITKAYGLRRAHTMRLVGYPKFDGLVRGEKAENPLFSGSGPVILYAPTWISENSGTKLDFSPWGESSLPLWGVRLVKAIAPRWNMIIKYHSRINENSTGIYDEIDRCIDELGAGDRVKVVWDSGITEYMKQSDLMISDISAVCYEWMHTGRPIVFANPAPERYRPSSDPMSNTYAWRAGDVLYREEDIAALIEKNLKEDLYGSLRQELLRETFHLPDGHATERQVSEVLELLDKADKTSFFRLFLHNGGVFVRDAVRYIRLLFE